MIVTTTADIAGTAANIEAVLSRVLLERAVPLLCHDKFGKIIPIPLNGGRAGFGKSLTSRRFEALTATPNALLEGVPPAGSKLSISDVKITPKQYGDYVPLTDVLVSTEIDPILVETAELLAEQAGAMLDLVYREPLNAGSVSLMNAGVANRAALVNKMDDTNGIPALEKAVRLLNIANAQPITEIIRAGVNVGTKPVRGGFYAICHPYVQYDMEKITGFQHISEYASQGDAIEGEFGAYKNIRFVSSTNAKMFDDTLTNATAGMYQHPSTAKNAAFSVLIFAKNAYGIVPLGQKNVENIIMGLGSAGAFDPLRQLQTSGWKAYTGAGILNDNFMVRIETCASA